MTDEQEDEDVQVVKINGETVVEIVNVLRSAMFAVHSRVYNGHNEYVKFWSSADAPEEMDDNDSWFWSSIVINAVNCKDDTLEYLHANWLTVCEEHGWSWNTYYDPEKKVSPLLLPFERLSMEEIMLVRLFTGIVFALAVEEETPETIEEE